MTSGYSLAMHGTGELSDCKVFTFYFNCMKVLLGISVYDYCSDVLLLL